MNKFTEKDPRIKWFSLKINMRKSLKNLIDLTSYSSYKIVSNLNIDTIKRFVKISLDKRLLIRILKGARYALKENQTSSKEDFTIHFVFSTHEK